MREPDRTINVPSDTFPGSNTIQVSVSYRKGGTNGFSGNEEARGYELTVHPIDIRPDGCMAFTIGANNGARFFVAPAARLDRKRLARLQDAILPHAAVIAGALENGDRAGIKVLVLSCLLGVK